MAKEEKPASVEKPEKPASVSATELAQAFIEALKQSTVTRGDLAAAEPDSITLQVRAAIEEYQAIAADLETLPLPR